MTETAAPQVRYRFVPYGGGVEELDRIGVRDHIRNGDIQANTELSLVNSEEWRAAASFPELARYFELAATSGRHAVLPTKTRQVRSMSERVVQGLLYPISGGEVFTLLGLGILSVIPIIGWAAGPATIFIMLDIIRTSADGKTKMPPVIDTSRIGELIRMYVRVLAVMLVSMAPIIAAGIWSWNAVLDRSAGVLTVVPVMLVASVLAAIYYPACLATVAVWDSVVSALNPVYVFRVISLIGRDYFVVIGVWFVGTFGGMFLRAFTPLASIPIVGSVFNSILALWVLFYASHLLGYAVYRHAPELGWE